MKKGKIECERKIWLEGARIEGERTGGREGLRARGREGGKKIWLEGFAFPIFLLEVENYKLLFCNS